MRIWREAFTQTTGKLRRFYMPLKPSRTIFELFSVSYPPRQPSIFSPEYGSCHKATHFRTRRNTIAKLLLDLGKPAPVSAELKREMTREKNAYQLGRVW